MDSSAVRRKMEDDDRKGKRETYDDATSAMQSSISMENTRFIKDQKGQQQALIEKQDVQLGHLGEAVDRLGEIGRGVNQELKEQTVLLDNLDREVDDASNKMNVVQAALSKLLKTKDGCQIWTIVILGVILVILGE